ncbi:major facilitator superfamily domain-containing protein [Cokeromyces recurvatus]|uniref:major facilitator superfamily domain-containing protein n=1 Tax=Cokeromyces recurvatus TaxID=90255 RepID=UPI00221FB51D|nr:major facilitator superfamily domain-containing protein [Cokeromyces recurvatus]KAI7906633.1 major facilitator superfamily domain-containing protein [Cokeromyces recurvatus]
MGSLEKRSNASLYGNRYEIETINQYDIYRDDDVPISMEEKSLVRKIDFFLMPIICIIDFLQFLDKSTINYAAALDFKQDLTLVGNQYSLIGSIFYLGYLLYQLPNNYFLQTISVGRYIGIIVFLWGIILTCTAAGTNFSQIIALRFLLGFFEAGVYPSLTLLVSTFYRRSEQATRLGAFWLCNGVALIMGGLITYGIDRMGNARGLPKWKWIMIILGSITAFMGIFSFFFLIDNPKSPALRLNAEQEILVEERTRDNAVVRTSMIKKDQIWEALKEARFWCFCFSCLFINLQNGAMTIYNTQFAMGFGYNGLQAVLLSVGAGGADIIFIVGSIYIVHKTKQTIYTAIGLMVIDIIGLILLLVIPNPHIKLVGFYLAWSYCAAYVLMVTSISNNVSGYTKKIFYNGILMIFYTIGNFVGPLLIVESQAPRYIGAMVGYIVANSVVVVLLLIARWKMAVVNKRRLMSANIVVTNVEDDLSDVQDTTFFYRL